MKIVKQLNDFMCVPACLESYLSDRGFSVTQAEFLKHYPHHFNVGNHTEGAFDLSDASLEEIGKDFGFSAKRTLSFLSERGRDYFIVTTVGAQHCVRVKCHLGQGLFQVMDPNINRGNAVEEFIVFDCNSEAQRLPIFLEFIEIANADPIAERFCCPSKCPN
jgi:hypothetical protein